MSVKQQFLNPLFGDVYRDMITGYFGPDLIAYFPSNEKSGSVADNYQGDSDRDGAFVGVTLADSSFLNGDAVPYYDGVNDVLKGYSAELASLFDGASCGVITWWKPEDASVWSDGVNRYFYNFRVDANNLMLAYKILSAAKIRFQYQSGGTNYNFDTDVLSFTDWAMLAHSANEAGDERKCWLNDTLLETTNGLGTWAGSVQATSAVFGAFNDSLNSPINGWTAHHMVIGRPLTQADINFVYANRYAS